MLLPGQAGGSHQGTFSPVSNGNGSDASQGFRTASGSPAGIGSPVSDERAEASRWTQTFPPDPYAAGPRTPTPGERTRTPQLARSSSISSRVAGRRTPASEERVDGEELLGDFSAAGGDFWASADCGDDCAAGGGAGTSTPQRAPPAALPRSRPSSLGSLPWGVPNSLRTNATLPLPPTGRSRARRGVDRLHPLLCTEGYVPGDWGRSERLGINIPASHLNFVRANDTEQAQFNSTWSSAPILEEPHGLSSSYTLLLQTLIEAPPAPSNEDTGDLSECEEIDQEFGAVAVQLERFRARPTARGYTQLRQRDDEIPSRPWELVENVTFPAMSSDWGWIPRDAQGHTVVSEWFPFRPRPHEDGACPACELILEQVRESLREGRDGWGVMAQDSDRTPIAAGPAFPWLATVSRGVLALNVNSHSCPLGDFLPFPRVLFSNMRRVTAIRHLQAARIRFRLVVHLGIPGGLPVRWTARTFVRMVFPLFGAVRYFWGRALLVSGELTFSGGPAGSRAGVAVTGLLRLGVVYRHRGHLEHAPLGLSTTYVEGARPDVTLLGASLQWLGQESASRDDRLVEPEAVTSADLYNALNTEDVPSSLLFWDASERRWRVRLPEALRESCSSRSFLGQREE